MRCHPHQGNDRCGIQTPSRPAPRLCFLLASRQNPESVLTKSIRRISPTRDDPARFPLLPKTPWRYRYPREATHRVANESTRLLQFQNAKIPSSRARSADPPDRSEEHTSELQSL